MESAQEGGVVTSRKWGGLSQPWLENDNQTVEFNLQLTIRDTVHCCGGPPAGDGKLAAPRLSRSWEDIMSVEF